MNISDVMKNFNNLGNSDSFRQLNKTTSAMNVFTGISMLKKFEAMSKPVMTSHQLFSN